MKGVVNVKRTNPMNVVKRIKGSLTRFIKEEDGVGVVEVVLILVEIYTYKRYVYPVYSIP